MVVSGKSGGVKKNNNVNRGHNVNHAREAQHSMLDNLAFPPVLLVPVAILVMVVRDPLASVSRNFSFPALLAMLITYIAMSVVFISLRRNNQQKAANSLSLLANGVLLLFLSFTMNLGEIFSWAGTGLIGWGVVILMSQVVTPPKTQFAHAGIELLPENISHIEVKKLLDAMAFPSAFLKRGEDGEDRVIALNDTLASVVGLGKNALQARGTLFSTLIPKSDGNVTFKFADAEWVPHRTTKGTQTLFMLTPVLKSSDTSAPTDAIDQATGLFTPLFLKYRANADVEACRRYGRKLSVVLFRISFDKAKIQPSEQAIKNAFTNFGKMVAASLRACDSGYRLREDEVLVYLPDTPQSGSKTVVNRVMDRVRKLSQVECVELATADIEEVTINYFGDEVSSVDNVMNDMYIAMGRKKEK